MAKPGRHEVARRNNPQRGAARGIRTPDPIITNERTVKPATILRVHAFEAYPTEESRSWLQDQLGQRINPFQQAADLLPTPELAARRRDIALIELPRYRIKRRVSGLSDIGKHGA